MRSAAVALILTALLFSSAFVAIRYAVGIFGPGELALLRMAVASLTFACLALARGLQRPRPRDLLAMAAAGLCGVTIYQLAINAGERTVGAGAASMLVNTGPVLTAVLSSRFLNERLRPRAWVGVFLGALGALIIGYAESGGLRVEPGLVFVGIATIAQPLFIVLQRPLLRRYSAFDVAAMITWFGTMPLVLYAPSLTTQITRASSEAVGAAIYLGLGTTVIGFSAFAFAISRLGATRAASFQYALPLTTVLIAWLVLGEIPQRVSFVGAAIALAGVALVQRRGAVAEGLMPQGSARVTAGPSERMLR